MKFFLTPLFLFLQITLGFSQFVIVTGNIKNKQTGQIEAGINIMDRQMQVGTITDDWGNFKLLLSVRDTYQLEVTALGFEVIKLNLTSSEVEKFQQIQIQNNPVQLENITIYSPLVHKNQPFSKLDIQLRPIINSQEILRLVPGLFIGQHAGGGKAEQIFLRGFDLDHGTDIQLTVDGIPVNMVSHAHGQGYADLHFSIPELVEQVEFAKGVYHAEKGNFATAGWVNFKTKEKLSQQMIKMEVGQYNTYRTMAAINLLSDEASIKGNNAYIAGEYSYSDSYFENPQDFKRINLQGRWTGSISEKTKFNLTANYFSSSWNHSGQIPDRAVENGLISFFGSIDPTEGGNTGRSIINFRTNTKLGSGQWSNQLFFSQYNFTLFSNFTFFLNDPLLGDQILQKENRNLMGLNSIYSISHQIGNKTAYLRAGMQVRFDHVKNNELSSTFNRTELISPIQFGDVKELNTGLFFEEDIRINTKWSLNVGLRGDYFSNAYFDRIPQPIPRWKRADAAILSPKFNIYYTPSDNVQFFINSGKGFHSNDTRVVVPQNGREILPPAWGFDGGVRLKPNSKILIQTGLWSLHLKDELVYVGDAGIVEPSGATQRWGIDWSSRFQHTKVLFSDIDLTYSHPRSVNDPKDENFIPLAPIFTATGGLSIRQQKGFNGSIRGRYLSDRPANEDFSLVAKGYFLLDLQANYTLKKVEFGINLQNILNSKWKETQFATLSRLKDEIQAVEEIHFTPGTPFFARFSLTYLWY
jgi:hypothetical protein